MLNREVRAVLHSSDTNGSRVYGELVYPEGNTAASLAATLLDGGMAKYVDWSARMLPVRPPAAVAAAAALKKAEMAAQVRVAVDSTHVAYAGRVTTGWLRQPSPFLAHAPSLVRPEAPVPWQTGGPGCIHGQLCSWSAGSVCMRACTVWLRSSRACHRDTQNGWALHE